PPGSTYTLADSINDKGQSRLSKHAQALALSKPHIARHWRQRRFSESVKNLWRRLARALWTRRWGLSRPLGPPHSKPRDRVYTARGILIAARENGQSRLAN